MDSERLVTRFPFEGAVGEVLQSHFVSDAAAATLSAKFKLYYRLRPLIPIPLRQFLQRGRNQRLEFSDDWYLPLSFVQELKNAIASMENTAAIHPWPEKFEMASCLTHDVETKEGHDFVDKLAELEEKKGFRSVWNFIPYCYQIDEGLLSDLKQRGHEVGVHGYNHDGRLFESQNTFNARIGPINQAIRKMDCSGFRAPMVHRNLEWLQQLDADYDASCFDTDPYQAMPGGVGGFWPFLAGKLVELPYTLPQDHTLLVTLGETTARIWIEKFAFLRAYRGMALLITHPDYLLPPERLDVYKQYLNYLVDQKSCWHALPHEIASWWRERDQFQATAQATSPDDTGRIRMMDLKELGAG